MNDHPRIGVGVIVVRGRSFLFGKRKNAHGTGSWGFPGGHLHFGETVEECARREVFEETGLQISDFERAAFTNDIFTAENRHYVTLFMIGRHSEGEPLVKEPDRCECWRWFGCDEFPHPLFLPIVNLLEGGFRFDRLPLDHSRATFGAGIQK